MSTRKDYGEVKEWKYGARVEIHPGCDLWMQGAKYGTVRRQEDGKVVVKMDHPSVKRLQSFLLDRVRPA